MWTRLTVLYLLCAEAKLITENFRRGRRCSADSTEGGPLGEIYAGVCSEHVLFFFCFLSNWEIKNSTSTVWLFFFFFFFCFFGFFAWHLLNWAAAPPPSLILLFMQSLLHFTDHFSQRERERKKTKKTLLINFLSTANADRAGFWDGFRSAGTFEKWRESKRSVNTSLKSSCWSFFSFFFFFFCKLMYSNPPTLAWLTTPVSLNVLPVCSCCMSVRMYVSVDACSICSFVWIPPL